MIRKLARKQKQKMVAGPTMVLGAEVAAEAEEAEVVEEEMEATVEVTEIQDKAVVTELSILRVTVITAESGATSQIIVGTRRRTHICAMLVTGPCRIKKQQGRTLKSCCHQ